MENKIITKEEIEKYIILEFDKELHKILQYKYNNFIYNMYNNYDQSEKELDIIIKKIILSSWFIRNKKLHENTKLNLLVKFADSAPIIVTTEKDAMRLIGSEFEDAVKQQLWYYQEITVEIDDKEGFDNKILNYVQENRRDY